jgi:hypothetical protein
MTLAILLFAFVGVYTWSMAPSEGVRRKVVRGMGWVSFSIAATMLVLLLFFPRPVCKTLGGTWGTWASGHASCRNEWGGNGQNDS